MNITEHARAIAVQGGRAMWWILVAAPLVVILVVSEWHSWKKSPGPGQDTLDKSTRTGRALTGGVDI